MTSRNTTQCGGETQTEANHNRRGGIQKQGTPHTGRKTIKGPEKYKQNSPRKNTSEITGKSTRKRKYLIKETHTTGLNRRRTEKELKPRQTKTA